MITRVLCVMLALTVWPNSGRSAECEAASRVDAVISAADRIELLEITMFWDGGTKGFGFATDRGARFRVLLPSANALQAMGRRVGSTNQLEVALSLKDDSYRKWTLLERGSALEERLGALLAGCQRDLEKRKKSRLAGNVEMLKRMLESRRDIKIDWEFWCLSGEWGRYE